jgi:hypothetical protein
MLTNMPATQRLARLRRTVAEPLEPWACQYLGGNVGHLFPASSTIWQVPYEEFRKPESVMQGRNRQWQSPVVETLVS